LEGLEKVLKALIVTQKKVLNSSEAAIYLKYTRGHIYRLINTQDLPFFKPNGTRYYFKRKELDYWRLTGVHPIKAKAKKIVLGFSKHG